MHNQQISFGSNFRSGSNLNSAPSQSQIQNVHNLESHQFSSGVQNETDNNLIHNISPNLNNGVSDNGGQNTGNIDEYDDDDSDDAGSSSKRRRATQAQISTLEDAFSVNPNPDADMRKMLAEKCDMTPRSVQIWVCFSNKLAERNGAQIDPTDTAALIVISKVSKRGRKQGTVYPRKSQPEIPTARLSSLYKKRMPKYKPTPAVLVRPGGGNADLIVPPPPPQHPPVTIFQNSIGRDDANGDNDSSGKSGFLHDVHPHHLPKGNNQHAHHNIGRISPPQIHTLQVDTLLWGTWRRTLTPADQTIDLIPDLQMHMDSLHRLVYITITSGGGQFRVEISFDSIVSITVEDRHYPAPISATVAPNANNDDGNRNEQEVGNGHLENEVEGEGNGKSEKSIIGGGASAGNLGTEDVVVTAVTFTLGNSGGITFPRFFMQLPPSVEWLQCSDFTENSQGTTVPTFTVLAGGGVDGVGTGRSRYITGSTSGSGSGGFSHGDALKSVLAEVVTGDKWLSQCVGGSGRANSNGANNGTDSMFTAPSKQINVSIHNPQPYQQQHYYQPQPGHSQMQIHQA
ncbi:hypothetical protein HK100_007759, partial [Physocladia obscura]